MLRGELLEKLKEELEAKAGELVRAQEALTRTEQVRRLAGWPGGSRQDGVRVLLPVNGALGRRGVQLRPSPGGAQEFSAAESRLWGCGAGAPQSPAHVPVLTERVGAELEAGRAERGEGGAEQRRAAAGRGPAGGPGPGAREGGGAEPGAAAQRAGDGSAAGTAGGQGNGAPERRGCGPSAGSSAGSCPAPPAGQGAGPPVQKALTAPQGNSCPEAVSPHPPAPALPGCALPCSVSRTTHPRPRAQMGPPSGTGPLR